MNEIKKLGGLVEYKVRIGGPLWPSESVDR